LRKHTRYLFRLICRKGRGNEEAGSSGGIGKRKSCFAKTYGGRSRAASMGCIRNMKCSIGGLTRSVKLIIEIKGFGPHVREMDRQKYCNELNRETFLASMGYQVISFAYDDVAARPELCMTLLRMVLSRYRSDTCPAGLKSTAEREIVRLAFTLARPLRPIDVETHLGMNHRTAVRIMKELCAKGWFLAVSGANGRHIVRYELHAAVALPL
jgi:hypothetical protein